MTFLSSQFVGLHHGAQGVLAHVVVHLDVLTLESQVTVELHLLTSDTRAVCHSVLNLLSVGQCQLFHLVEALALIGNSSVENALSQGDEVSTVSHEVGLALQGDHSGKAVYRLHENTTVRCFTVATLSSNSQTTLAQQFLSLCEVALCLCQSLLHVGQTCTSHGTQLFDIFN